MTFIELIKNAAVVLGFIISATSVITLCTKGGRKLIGNIFSKYTTKQNTEIEELKDAIVELKNEVSSLRQEATTLKENSEITIEFTKQQCRNTIKEIFYKYCDTEILPLYEYKTLIATEDIYVGKLHGNSYAQEMLKIMFKWKIDYTKSHVEED